MRKRGSDSMGKSDKRSASRVEGSSSSSDPKRSEDMLETLNPKKKTINSSQKVQGSPSPAIKKAEGERETDKIKTSMKIDSIGAEVSSIKAKMVSIKLNLNSAREDINSIKTILPLLPTKEDLQLIFTSMKETAQKKAKADTKETDEVVKETPKQTYAPFSFNMAAESSKSAEFTPFRRVGWDTIFVKGFDTSISDDDIKRALTEHFSPCGTVKNVYFHKKASGVSIVRYAFIVMPEAMEEALKLNGSDMGGFKIEVDKATERPEFYGDREGGGPYIPPPNRRRISVHRGVETDLVAETI